jgi:hypothetical protein
MGSVHCGEALASYSIEQTPGMDDGRAMMYSPGSTEPEAMRLRRPTFRPCADPKSKGSRRRASHSMVLAVL